MKLQSGTGVIRFVISNTELKDMQHAFDESFYRKQMLETDLKDVLPLEHYATLGWRQGLDPAPDFSTSDYLKHHADVREAAINPLLHFVRHGKEEQRKTFPSKVGRKDIQITERQKGLLEEAFDAEFYSEQCHVEDFGSLTPLEHYLTTGWLYGLDPSADFSTNIYLSIHSDVREAGINPLLHYVLHGHEEGRCLALKAKGHADDSEDNLAVSQLAEAFDQGFYKGTNPDIDLSSQSALDHYLNVGWLEGRDPSPDFSTLEYLARHADVRNAETNPFVHYDIFGKTENRFVEPSAAVNPVVYDYDTFAALHGKEFDPGDVDDVMAVCSELAEEQRPRQLEIALILHTPPLESYDDQIKAQLLRNIRRALYATTGAVYVVGGELLEASVQDLDERRIRFRSYRKRSMAQVFLGILQELPAGPCVVWDAAVTPSLCALPLLEKTFQRLKGVALIGSTVLDASYRVISSGFEVTRDGCIRPLYTGRRAISADAFRYHGCLSVDASLCILDTAAWLDALKGARPRPKPATIQGLFAEACRVLWHEPEKMGIQGCSIVRRPFSPVLPEGADGYPLSGKTLSVLLRAIKQLTPKQTAVVIDSRMLRPDNDAGSVTTYHLLKILKDRGMDVLFYADAERIFNVKYTTMLAAEGIRCLYGQRYADLATVIDLLRSNETGSLTFFLNRVHSGGRHFERLRGSFPKAKIIFNTIDLHGVRELRAAEVCNNSHKRFQAMRTIARETALVQQADATMVVSEHEKDLLDADMPYANVHMIPLILNFASAIPDYDDRQDILFVGSFLHTPNVDAVEYFVAEVWDGVRKALPGVRFKIAGGHFPDWLAKKMPDDVEVLGFVEDLTSLLESVRLTVAPIRYGAGIKGKVGTSLAHGVPCVASPMAAEGMNLTHETNILVADGTSDFADQVRRVYTEKDLWLRLSQEGFAFCERFFTSKAISQKIEKLFATLGAQDHNLE